MTTYNGHKNWNHWNVSLWLSNDGRLYEEMKDAIRFERSNKDKAAERLLQVLHAMGIETTPDGAPYSKSSLRAAMRGE